MFKNLWEKVRKRIVYEVFFKIVDVFDDFELVFRIKCVVWWLLFVLMIYVCRESEKVYNVIMLEEVIVESLKLVLFEKYGILLDLIMSFVF